MSPYICIDSQPASHSERGRAGVLLAFLNVHCKYYWKKGAAVVAKCDLGHEESDHDADPQLPGSLMLHVYG